MYSVGVRPSYKTGFAQWPGMSEYPQLWKGLVGAWDMSLGITGTKVSDLSENGNVGTFGNSPTWNSGPDGSIIDFDTNDYIGMDNVNNFAFERTDSFSVRVIFKVNAAAEHILVGNISVSTGIGWEFAQVLNDRLGFYLVNDTSPSNRIRAAVDNVIYAGNWYDAVATYNGNSDVSGVKMYINGVSQTVGSVSNDLTASILSGKPITIGGRDRITSTLNGSISIVSIWNRVITASETTLLHQLRKRLA